MSVSLSPQCENTLVRQQETGKDAGEDKGKLLYISAIFIRLFVCVIVSLAESDFLLCAVSRMYIYTVYFIYLSHRVTDYYQSNGSLAPDTT